MKIVFIGPAGAGKGTYSTELSSALSIPAISMGNLIREEVKNKTELGKVASPIIDRGELIPLGLTDQILKSRLSKKDCENGFILDGYPRNMLQLKSLERVTKIDVVINLKVSKKVVLQRLSNRRTCSKCGKIYHLINIPPKNPEICDICGGKLEQRKDDVEKAIEKRLKVYNEETKPLIDYYRKQNIVADINAEQKLNDAMRDIFLVTKNK